MNKFFFFLNKKIKKIFKKKLFMYQIEAENS